MRGEKEIERLQRFGKKRAVIATIDFRASTLAAMVQMACAILEHRAGRDNAWHGEVRNIAAELHVIVRMDVGCSVESKKKKGGRVQNKEGKTRKVKKRMKNEEEERSAQ